MAGKNKTYELMLKIGGKVDGSLKTACSTADKNLAALGKTAKTAGKIAAGAMVAAATAVATLGTAAVKSAAEYEAQLANRTNGGNRGSGSGNLQPHGRGHG